MQRILNDPDCIVDEMLQGFLNVHPDIVAPTESPGSKIPFYIRGQGWRSDRRRFRT